MKKYIKPTIEIEISDLEMTLLAGLSKYDTKGSDDDEFSNTASYDDEDVLSGQNAKGLWDED